MGEIQLLMFHCKDCISDIENGKAGTNSPQEYARLEVCMENDMMHVACVRHQQIVVSVRVHPDEALLKQMAEGCACEHCECDGKEPRLN